MPGGGFSKLPNGSVVVALSLPSPAGDGSTVRFLVHALNRARALTRLRNLGLRAVYLRGNAEPPTPDEITAVLHHPDGLLWRETPADHRELWRPIRALLGPGTWASAAPEAPKAPDPAPQPAPRLTLPQPDAVRRPEPRSPIAGNA
ncbi:hypothetical protein FBY35_6387 [Streptomyces sp. SLBN-118]|nr:hypothetical protein FBY35_6387 [Streptomyces sp. SLBN-118]